MFGSTETTFYVLAVYFGSVGIRKTDMHLQLVCSQIGWSIECCFLCQLFFAESILPQTTS
ncbi:hypothetical protein Ct9H90mP29_02660 [bacterium]|nr:MAG: hypothetical protein Ct9H90mP29_02660 [bacterium]